MPSLRLFRAAETGDATAGPGAPIVFTAATAGKKADGLDLAGLPWDLSRGVGGGDGARFPFLWVHDMMGERLPMGVAEVQSAPDELPLRVAWHPDPEDEFAMRVAAKYRSPVGGLSAVSVSWDDVDKDGMPVRRSGGKAVAHQLLEVSGVPVPLDADALQEGARAAMRAFRDDLDAMLADFDAANAEVVDLTGEDDEPAEASPPADEPEVVDGPAERADADDWPDIAAAMVDVFDRATQLSDPQRRRQWKGLKGAYMQRGKSWPEWVAGDELRVLDDANWRALFVAGELDVVARAGAELSSRNVAELAAALDAITGGAKRIRALLDRVQSKGADDSEDATGDKGGSERATTVLDSLARYLETKAATAAGESNG